MQELNSENNMAQTLGELGPGDQESMLDEVFRLGLAYNYTKVTERR